MNITLERDPVATVNDCSYQIRADHFLVQFFATATHIGINHCALRAGIGAQLFEGLSVHLVALLFLFHSFLTLRADRRTRPARGIIHNEFIDDDAIKERNPLVETAPVFEMIISRFALGIYPCLRDEPLTLS